MRGLLWVVLVGVAIPSLPARADDFERNAREFYDQAQKAYALGHFTEAVELFEHAFALSPRPLLLWDIAHAWENPYAVDDKVEDLRKARALYENFTKYESVSAKDRSEALEKVAALDERIARATKVPSPAEAAAASQAGAGNRDLAAAPVAGTRSRRWLWVGLGVGAAVIAAGAVAAAVALAPHDASPPSTTGGILTLSLRQP